MPVDISRELSQIRAVPGFNWLHEALVKLLAGINNLGTNLAGDTGTLGAPPRIQGIQVKSSNTGLVHVVLNDNSDIQRGIHYFVEYDTVPGVVTPHVVHMGASREILLRLPGKTDGGVAQSFYFRGYSQYPGSMPSKPLYFNGAVAPGGTDTLTLLAPTGSGTAASNGLQGGSGFGATLKRTL